MPAGCADGIQEKILEVTPVNIFVNKGEVTQSNHVEADPHFADRLKRGVFDAELTFLIRTFYPLVSGECVKGRAFYPLPLSVKAKMERALDGSKKATMNEVLKEITYPVEKDLDGTNYKILNCALEFRLCTSKLDANELASAGVLMQKGQAHGRDDGGKA